MEHFFSLVQSVIILVVLILLTLYLKKRQIISPKDNTVFSKLVTDYTLPALIFANLARQHIDPEQLLAPIVMLSSILISMLIGWGFGKILRLPDKKLGVFIVLAGFGSSSSLGYPLVKQVFPGNQTAMSDALIIGELGSCLPFFVIGVAILVYYGRKEGESSSITTTLYPFLKSPIFIAMVLGILVSFINLPEDSHVINLVFSILNIIGGSMLLFVAISLGLMLKPVQIRSILGVLIAVVLIKLFFEPLLCLAGANILDFPELEKEILIIEAGMPSGAVATVVANRYGCDGSFGSILMLITYFVGIISVPLMFYLSIL